MRFLIKRAVLAADKWLGWHTGEIAFNGIRYVLCWSLSHYTGGCTTHGRRYTCKNVHALLSSQFVGVGPYARWPKNRHIHFCLPVPLEVFSLMDFNYGWAGCHEHGSKDVDRRAVSHTGPMSATLSECGISLGSRWDRCRNTQQLHEWTLIQHTALDRNRVYAYYIV